MARRTREYIYGINPAFEVIRGKRRRLYEAFLSRSGKDNPRLKKLVRLLEQADIPYEWVDKGRVLDLSGSKENQGVVLKTSTYPYAPFEDLLAEPRLLLLDNVEDPHNVGAVLRSAEIFGFSNILLTRKGTPEVYPSVVKVSAGATEFLRISKECSANQYARRAKEAGYSVVALDAHGDARLEDIDTDAISRLLLVVGGEDKSVGQFILNHADHVASISQHGRINSLNASVAAAIAMYALGDKRNRQN